MEHEPVQNIVSFVIRFVQEQPDEQASRPRYRGAIRHVQSDQEVSFTNWSDAVAFMQRYMPLESLNSDNGNIAPGRSVTRQDDF